MRIKVFIRNTEFLLMSIAMFVSSGLRDENYEYSSDATIRAWFDTITKGVYYKFTIDPVEKRNLWQCRLASWVLIPS